MSLNQKLNEFRFNLETLDLLNNMGKSSNLLSEVGFNSELLAFMQNNRNLLNSVLLRLQLYNEQNMNEQKVRSGLSMLNNNSVNSLLNYLYKSSDEPKVEQLKVEQHKVEQHKVEQSKVEPKSKPSSPKPTLVIPAEPEEEPEEVEQENQTTEHDEEENYFEKFFADCVNVSDDATHVVKMSAMYDAFTKWWSNNYEDEVPSKDELKEFLSEKLNRQIKSTISNVTLI